MKIYVNQRTKDEFEKAESILFNGNGFLGVRGNLEEAYYDDFATNRETFINGFYESKKIEYPEKLFGVTERGESMISVIDGQTTFIEIGDEEFHLNHGEILDWERYVDLKEGQTVRQMIWRSPKGLETKIIIRRLASFSNKHIFTMSFEFEKLNHEEPIVLSHHLNFYPIRTIDKNDPRLNHNIQHIRVTEINQEANYCAFQTEHSKLHGKMYWHFSAPPEETQVLEDKIIIKTPITSKGFEKQFYYTLEEGEKPSFEKDFRQLAHEQRVYLDDFWETAKISITAEEKIEESVNYGTYALLQSLGTDGRTSISAKGLSGSGYEGHYFWDTEMYIFPLFLHSKPELAKGILQFRINTLEKARENRKLVGYRQGALYPWRTISGSESSAYFEAGMAQHHINGDIAYAFISYYKSTGDLSIFLDGGFDVLVETARVFLEIGHLKEDTFHIDKVTGPDEYSVLVNDNYYTNCLTAYHFEWVNKLAEILKKEAPGHWQEIAERLSIDDEEMEIFADYSKKIFKPFDEERGIIAQDRDFLNKGQWPYTKEETKYPLLLHYHPLTIYRYQVSKQADAVLALMLFPEELDKETSLKTVDYYDSVTTHDSSLSYSAFATVYSRLGKSDKAYQYFLENARCDLDNLHHNTKDGIHTASMGGTFMTIIYGFCNLQITPKGLTLSPKLPKQIEEIKFKVVYHGDVYQIEVTQEDYQLVKV